MLTKCSLILTKHIFQLLYARLYYYCVVYQNSSPYCIPYDLKTGFQKEEKISLKWQTK